jgi:hypothetical protein
VAAHKRNTEIPANILVAANTKAAHSPSAYDSKNKAMAP